MKPTILVLTSTFPRYEHDHEPRFVADLCLHLNRFFRIVVVTQHRPGTLTEENYHGIQVIRYRYAPRSLEILSENGGIPNTLSKKPWSWILVPGLVISQILAIKKAIKSEKPVAIHAHWLIPQTLAAIVSQAFSRTKIPIVSTSHGADLYGLQGRLPTHLKRWAIQSCVEFCVVSSAMQNYACVNLGIDRSKILVYPMGAYLGTIFKPDETVSRRPGKLLFVGRLVEKKGVEYLVRALKDLRAVDSRFCLDIAGYGPEEQSLRALTNALELQNYITFKGSLSHKELSFLYQQSEVCVLPFVESSDGDIEGLGLVAIEAMGCKCPVVAGNVPAISDIVTDEQTGLLCDPKTVSSVCDKILRLRTDKQLKDRLVKNAYNHIFVKYSWQSCAYRYVRMFENLS
jgi:glycosyltransferase involved in cell wall biosynthesis